MGETVHVVRPQTRPQHRLHLLGVLLLAGCGGNASPAAAPDAPEAPAAPEPPKVPEKDPMAGACTSVVTANDATTIFQLARKLEGTGTCTFEDVKAEKTIVNLAFETAEKAKAPSTLTPLACKPEPPEGAIVKGHWVLEVPATSREACPEGYAVLEQALGRFPPPSTAQ